MQKQKYTIIDNTPIKTLEEYCKEKKLNFNLKENSGQWGAFAHRYGEQKGYTTYKLISFTNMVTMLLADTKLEDRSQEFIKETLILSRINKINKNIQADETITNTTKAQILFKYIVDIYDDANFDSKYAIAKITKAIKFSYDQIEKINQYPASDFSKKLKYMVSIAPNYHKYDKYDIDEYEKI